jgi:hypothetical protein
MKNVVCLLVLSLFVSITWAQESEEGRTDVLEFHRMIGNSGKGNPANIIRGLTGAGAPWTILRSVQGDLDANGMLRVRVRGLVIAAPDNNPVPQFRAVLSCLDPNNPAGGITVATNPFPATTGFEAGDADIEQKITIPSPCFAPLVFITAPNGTWFVVTGISAPVQEKGDGERSDQ